MKPEGLPDPLEVAVSISRILTELDLAHVIGGSLASSVHGEPRTTNDIDIVVDLRIDDVTRLIGAVQRDYYVSESAAREAIRFGGSFNLIHLHKAVKVDLFIAGTDPLDAERLKSPKHVRVSSEPDAWLPVDTAEHSILRKLQWFRKGGETSDRQWRDVISMLRVQRERLDHHLLREWSARLGIEDLLNRAFAEVGDREG